MSLLTHELSHSVLSGSRGAMTIMILMLVSTSASIRLPFPLPLVDNIIIGAGGAGLQAALLLKASNMSYVVLEKGKGVGSFWHSFPIFGELISINKSVRNETQMMRFDWHSFLGTKINMRDTTRAYFPHRTHVVDYFERVSNAAALDIRFNVEVIRVQPSRPCVVLHGEVIYCAKKRVLIATGLVEKKEPLLEAMGGVPYSQFKATMAAGKSVCIIGNGNRCGVVFVLLIWFAACVYVREFIDALFVR
jgi:cation diffusion facilitator CzcD-associated flavoprotein CzcO